MTRGTLRTLLITVSLIIVMAGGLWYALGGGEQEIITGQVVQLSGNSANGFKQATDPRAFTFPRDHGPHPDYQTEWWYYTGSLESESGRLLGYQLTFFRQGLSSKPISRTSEWATNDVYFAHFTVSDIDGERFDAAERVDRGGGAGLAGAEGNPYHIFVESWSAKDEGGLVKLSAQDEDVAIALNLRSEKQPTLQGNGGLSPKSEEPGKASYYYSLTHLATTGTITVGNDVFRVNGVSWFDHEWATNPLQREQVGWQWFGLHLDDGRDVMWGELRRPDGTVDWGGGSITYPTTQTTRIGINDVMILYPEDATLMVLNSWKSPETGIEYPSRWRLLIPKANLDLEVVPLLADQELRLKTMVYWEGAAKVAGNADGRGYVELTGYGQAGSPLR
jgi:predicted secreted hydrolase